jgi:hypothetical protein
MPILRAKRLDGLSKMAQVVPNNGVRHPVWDGAVLKNEHYRVVTK